MRFVRAATGFVLGALVFAGWTGSATADPAPIRYYETPSGVSSEQLLAAASVDLGGLPGPAFGRAADELVPVLPTIYTEHSETERTSMVPLVLFAGQPYAYVGAGTSPIAVEVRTGIDLFDTTRRAAQAFASLAEQGPPVGDHSLYGESPLQCPSGCPSVGEESRVTGILSQGVSTARLRFRRGTAIGHVDFDYRPPEQSGGARFVLPDRVQLLAALGAWATQLDRQIQALDGAPSGESALGVTASDRAVVLSDGMLLYLAAYPASAFPAAGPNEERALARGERLLAASYVPPESVDRVEANLITFADADAAVAWLAQRAELEMADNARRLRPAGTGTGSVFVGFDVGTPTVDGPLPPRGFTYRFRSGEHGAEVYCEEPHGAKRCEALARSWAQDWARRLRRA